MFNALKQLALHFLYPVKKKEAHEFNYWKQRFDAETELANDHFEFFYTTHFGFKKEFYDDKVIVDIGCGPRGSLEWADNTKRRIGVDPLAEQYKELGTGRHAMEYLSCPAEKISLPSETCDAVFSFNSLDHVSSVQGVLNEVERLLKPNGLFMLLVEVNQTPTSCEPHELNAKDIIETLVGRMQCLQLAHFKPIPGQGMYPSIQANLTVASPERCTEKGYLSAKFCKLDV